MYICIYIYFLLFIINAKVSHVVASRSAAFLLIRLRKEIATALKCFSNLHHTKNEYKGKHKQQIIPMYYILIFSIVVFSATMISYVYLGIDLNIS